MNPLQHYQHQAKRCTLLCTTASIVIAIAPSPVRADRAADFKQLEAENAAASEKFSQQRSDVKPPPDSYFIRRVETWPRWQLMPRYTALAEADPTDDIAYQCCLWILQTPGFAGDRVQFAAEQKAWPILAAHHASGDKVPQLCLKAAAAASPVREQLLRDLLKKPNLSKDHIGFATLALAESIIMRMNTNELFNKQQKQPVRELVNYVHSREAPDYASYISETNTGACKTEAATLLRTVIDHFGDVPETISRRRLATLGDRAKQSLYALEHLTVGAVAPPIVGQDLDGHALKLEDFRGRVVVLSFWFTGCGACMEMIPEERKLTEKFKDRPFSLLGICGDEDREQAKKTATEEKITWPCWFDGSTEGPVARAYNINGWPTFCLIDQTGHIVDKDMVEHGMETTIANLLEKNGSKK